MTSKTELISKETESLRGSNSALNRTESWSAPLHPRSTRLTASSFLYHDDGELSNCWQRGSVHDGVHLAFIALQQGHQDLFDDLRVVNDLSNTRKLINEFFDLLQEFGNGCSFVHPQIQKLSPE